MTFLASKVRFPRIGPITWSLIGLVAGTVVWQMVISKDIDALTMKDQQELARQAADWIRAEQSIQRPLASPLAPSEIELFAPFFPRDILLEARVHAVEEMPSPKFLGSLRHQGRQILDFRRALSLALDDTVLLRGVDVPPGSPSRRSVLFHELVHCVQYRALGVDAFVDHYLASLISNNYRYPDIVFEHQAFELQHRFNMQPNKPFSVAAEVEQMVADHQLLVGNSK